MKEDFYIGYLPKMPKTYLTASRIAVVVIFLLVVTSGFVTGFFQRQFNDGNFEFGQLTEVRGILTTDPVPRLMIGEGVKVRSIVLVGFGKMGAEGTIEGMENVSGEILEGREVTLQGTLIYGEGKSFMELTAHDESLVEIHDSWGKVNSPNEEGEKTLVGEIIDPKCYFGVMKPGEGKTHRACAVRCVSGGIPPVLRVAQVGLRPEFYFLKGISGERLNAEVLEFIADRVEVEGESFRLDDWRVLHIDPSGITRITH